MQDSNIETIKERKVQNEVVKFFKEELKYNYIGNLEDKKDNTNIIYDSLNKFLSEKMEYSEKIVVDAIAYIYKIANGSNKDLYDTNKKVYELLRYGKEFKDENQKSVHVYYVDFKDLTNNIYEFAEEVTVIENNNKRPDIVTYVNGIAVSIIELKRSSVSVEEGIRQNIGNQDDNYIKGFFTTMQILVAGNPSEGLKYGTIKTPSVYYCEWKKDNYNEFLEEKDDITLSIENKLVGLEDKYSIIGKKFLIGLYNLYYIPRFMDIIDNYIIFDNGIKKVCRYNQYYAMKRVEHRILKGCGGIVWHTQGSGKSLIMVWLTKWIKENTDKRVLIITDREELDEQIEKAFLNSANTIVRTMNCEDLYNALSHEERGRVVCSLIHKFGAHNSEKDVEDEIAYNNYIEDLKKSKPKDIKISGDFVIFVDECHRTQSGILHESMKEIINNGIFIGFTGTPLLKKQKFKNNENDKSSIKKFGSYIHVYTYKEGVEDKVVLDLVYDPRNIEVRLDNRKKVDEWFNSLTIGLSDIGKGKLKQEWAKISKIYSSKDALEKVALDIKMDFMKNARLCGGRGNAMLVASSVYEACKYYEIFQNIGFKECAIVTSYKPNNSVISKSKSSVNEVNEELYKNETYKKMIDGYKSPEDFEKDVKKKFIEQPNDMKLLIVVNKLLTGFDAPKCTYLYIDKHLQDQGLFQAICRVNRPDDETKTFGYVVDYKGLFSEYKDAIKSYTSIDNFGYDDEDINGLLHKPGEIEYYDFKENLEKLSSLLENIEDKSNEQEFIKFFCGDTTIDNIEKDEFECKLREGNRRKFYSYVSRLSRDLAGFKPFKDKLNIDDEKLNEYTKVIKNYVDKKEVVYKASSDYIDLKKYDADMRFIFDTYIKAKDSERVEELKDMTIMDIIIESEKNENKENVKRKQSNSEIIEARIRHEIVEKKPTNPLYYDKLSKILVELIKKRKEEAIDYKNLLKAYKELCDKINGCKNYPENIKNSEIKKVLYDNLKKDERLVYQIYTEIHKNNLVELKNSSQVQSQVKQSIYTALCINYKNNGTLEFDVTDEKIENEVEEIFNLVISQNAID